MAKVNILPSIDPAACGILEWADSAGISTSFSRAADFKPCTIGNGQSGVCCKNCYMGPCRITKDGQVGICGATVETIAVGSAAVTLAGPTVTIDPSVTLAELTEYYVEVAAGTLQDLAGNSFAGIMGATAWNFKTAGLLVTSLTPTATGFTASLNQSLATAELNLYDGYPASLGVADVTLVGTTTGPVRGSLVLSEGDRRITFIRTGGLRAADTASWMRAG